MRAVAVSAIDETETARPIWVPQPGPQTQAIESEADEILYGGEPGGGKTDLLLGIGLTRHLSVHLFRREATQLGEIVERLAQIVADQGRLTRGNLPLYRSGDHRIQMAGLKDQDDALKWAGRASDLKAFDELTQFTERQYLIIQGWGRTVAAGVRVQTVATCNPPVDEDATWIVRRWAAWLDPTHPEPAQSGEIRWYARLDDVDTECESGEPFEWTNADGVTETIYPSSRTFIRARLSDNAYLGDEYRRKIDGLPEPMRSILKNSDFMAMLNTSHPAQIIPTAWIRAAMRRWTPNRPELPGAEPSQDGSVALQPLSATALDVAQGGKDRTVKAKRYDWWVDKLLVVPGIRTPEAKDAAELINTDVLEGGYFIVDCDGVGGEVYGILYEQLGADRVRAYRGGKPTKTRDSSKTLEFYNVKAAAWWAMREALNPRTSHVALPPDDDLLQELAAPRMRVMQRKYIVEPKEDVISRLGRSPDLGDAVVMVFWSGGAAMAALPDSTKVAT